MDPSVKTTTQVGRPPNKKRPSQITNDNNGDQYAVPGEAASPSAFVETSSTSASSFRNVSACNRCRTRKNKCDQNLPACTGCVKANVQCVGYDPVLKREIPRRLVLLSRAGASATTDRPTTATSSTWRAESSTSKTCYRAMEYLVRPPMIWRSRCHHEARRKRPRWLGLAQSTRSKFRSNQILSILDYKSTPLTQLTLEQEMEIWIVELPSKVSQDQIRERREPPSRSQVSSTLRSKNPWLQALNEVSRNTSSHLEAP